MAAEKQPIELAHAPDFKIGAVAISPSHGKASVGDAEARVEPRVMEVLILLQQSASRTVTRDQLIDACWNGRAVSDDAVTRAIGKARHIGRLGGATHFTIETIPKVGFRLMPAEESRAEGSRPPTATAWPQPLPAPAAGRQSARSPVPALLAASGLLAIALMGFVAARSWAGEYVEIAPFAAGSEDEAVVVLASDVSDSIAAYLPGRSIVASEPPEASALSPRRRARIKVSGSVKRAEDRILVNVRISERASGIALWSAEFERPASTWRGLEESVGLGVGAALQCALAEQQAAERRFTTEVFSLWLRACDASRSGSDALAPARALMAAEPDRASSHAIFALAAAGAARWGDLPLEQSQLLLNSAEEAAQRALKLDPSDARAHTALSIHATSFAERERHLKRALEAEPDRALVLVTYIVFLREVGRLDDARKLGARTLRMDDPRLVGNLPHTAFLSAMAGDRATAEDAIRKYEGMFPHEGPSLRWTNAVWWEDPLAAASRLHTFGMRASYGDRIECFEMLLPRLPHGEAGASLPSSCDWMAPEWRARMLARLGDVDGAYAILVELEKQRLITQILFYPEMKSVRRDPRFMPLVRQLGLLAYWRETNQWPDFCREPDLPFDCRASAS